MKPGLLEYLACPGCGGALGCESALAEGREVIEGTLRCVACGAAFPVRGGIPRLLRDEPSAAERATAWAFGTQWRLLGLSDAFRAEFESYLAPLAPSDLSGLAILDAGCGAGKFTLAAAEAGARLVIGVDLSEAVEVAHRHLRHLPNAHVVQASIYQLPFRPGAFDLVFSLGVLHHLPDPEKGFQQLVPLAAPGGRMLVWLYALEGNEAFVRWVDPLRAHLFRRLPSWVNRVVATLLAVPLWAVIIGLYVPLGRRGRGAGLPYGEYFRYFSRLGFRAFWGTVYDKLVPPAVAYISREDLRRWLGTAGLTELSLRHRNRNSWSCLARRGHAA